jgi:uncharacterized protein
VLTYSYQLLPFDELRFSLSADRQNIQKRTQERNFSHDSSYTYMESDQQFLQDLVKALVDHPEAVKINRTVDEMGVLLTLDVHAEDMGKVIGRSGNTAKAIRTLLRVVGMKHNARVNLKINEPEGGTRSHMNDSTEDQGAEAVVDELPNTPKSLDEAIEGLRI